MEKPLAASIISVSPSFFKCRIETALHQYKLISQLYTEGTTWPVSAFTVLHTWGLSTTVCTLMGAGGCIWVVTLAGELSRLDEPLWAILNGDCARVVFGSLSSGWILWNTG